MTTQAKVCERLYVSLRLTLQHCLEQGDYQPVDRYLLSEAPEDQATPRAITRPSGSEAIAASLQCWPTVSERQCASVHARGCRALQAPGARAGNQSAPFACRPASVDGSSQLLQLVTAPSRLIVVAIAQTCVSLARWLELG